MAKFRRYKRRVQYDRPARVLREPNLSEYGSTVRSGDFSFPVEFPRLTMYYQSQRVAESVQRCLNASRRPLPAKAVWVKRRPLLKPIPPPEPQYMHIRKSRGMKGRMG